MRTVLLAYIGMGLGGALAVLTLSGPVSALLGEPSVGPYLRLLALETFFLCLALGHRISLVGTGQFAFQAGGSALRWMLRMILIIALVEGGLALTGVILGAIGSWVAELAYSRLRIRPPVLRGARTSFRPLFAVAGPLVFISFAGGFVESADLFFLQGLYRDTAEAGYYGAARSLALVPAFLGSAAVMPTLATLGHLTRDGAHGDARSLGRNIIRAVLVLVPLVAVASGSSREIVGVLMGPDFGPAAEPMAVLLLGAVAMLGMKLAVVILTAAGRPGMTMVVGGLLPVLAVGGFIAFVPRYGGLGAAGVTTGVAVGGAAALLMAVQRVWRGSFPVGTALRALALALAGYGAALAWPVSGLWVVPKLALLGVSVLAGFLVSRELSSSELNLLRQLPTRVAAWLRPVES